MNEKCGDENHRQPEQKSLRVEFLPNDHCQREGRDSGDQKIKKGNIFLRVDASTFATKRTKTGIKLRHILIMPNLCSTRGLDL
jgi:hypothetical protein